jgi:AraC family transcriptional regulator of adaptative response / DNA-3-methyladenine glycosylase II
LRDLTTATQRVRRLFDLDADPYAVAERLGADPGLAPLVARLPGLRSPGSPDSDEYAVRAVLGEGADPRPAPGAEELVAAYGTALPAADGTLTHLFPRSADLLDADLATVVPGPLADTLRHLCRALADGTVALDPGADRDAAERSLVEVPGVDALTAAHIRMRALGDPDVAAAEHAEGEVPGADGWRPWRSYGTHYGWWGRG